MEAVLITEGDEIVGRTLVTPGRPFSVTAHKTAKVQLQVIALGEKPSWLPGDQPFFLVARSDYIVVDDWQP